MLSVSVSNVILMPYRQMLERWMAKVGIKLFVIINKGGRIIDSFGNKDLSISKEKKDMLLMQMALQSSMQGDYNEEYGMVSSCIVQRNKLKFVCCPMGEGKSAIVVANKSTHNGDIVNHINQLAIGINTDAKGGTLLV